MHRTLLRTMTSAAVLAATFAAPLAPAHADDPGAGWTLVASGESAPAGVGNLSGLLATTSPRATCGPNDTGVNVYNLSWQEWTNGTQTAFDWYAGGEAWAKTSCATSVTVCAQITDYAGGGQPPVVPGDRECATSKTPEGDGRYVARTQARAWVLYYDYPKLYARGNSVVEVEATGTYTSRGTPSGTYPAGCEASYSSVTPTPAGPIVTGSGTTPCAT
jgi:hypothetical protein